MTRSLFSDLVIPRNNEPSLKCKTAERVSLMRLQRSPVLSNGNVHCLPTVEGQKFQPKCYTIDLQLHTIIFWGMLLIG